MQQQFISEDDILEKTRAYEAELREALGVPAREVRHFRRPVERPFTREERDRVTILFGGLTRTHDDLIGAAAEGLGYRVRPLPVPDNAAMALGKEYGNRGQCNPTYYTVGNLVKYLLELRAAGETDIEDRYVFLTAGACGPCRFGMYESEYRKALTEAGFPNFRVLIFQQTGGLEENGLLGAGPKHDGLVLDTSFYLAILRAIIASDIVNTMAHRIRPYEVEPGATDAVLHWAREHLGETFRNGRSLWLALRRIRSRFNEIEVDFLRVRPKVKITGEFWAQTTEGDGSYHLQRWLVAEGAEVVAEPVGTWIDYILWSAFSRTKESIGIRQGARRRLLALWIALCAYKSFYNFYRSALTFRTDPLVSQKQLAEYAGDYYNVRIGGGEGHMEVGKHFHAVLHRKAHMVTSIKPFGCMPSTQSDGVQSKVVSELADSVFIPIETSGDSEVNVKSRVQMKLFEAKQKAREELQRALDEYGVTLEEVQAYVERHPKFRRPMVKLPHDYVGTAPNFVAAVAKAMGRRRRKTEALPAGSGAAAAS
ncbi:2-hydroxyglutaryl-CoA dehydratase [Tepidiforma thermophila]|uniref:Putative nucleotide-binding protein (Sugar kinase/HSP70/actin superfamily) n=1 Tax=Tepidiforma thermophila (strain KCTC 52669 / CGMCC 1.13589 / G233) TaxID=2761530 RepID=A0A2A9HDS7_TEPT2|nr:2-hydroxyglutaryl-CoA dehydratase [Tepidiforma thermophila]PFG73301.1 putative nucleotide-binding protein (sugar kinase/HSP70/actin superfamily) [Tepidiforma thermophila]